MAAEFDKQRRYQRFEVGVEPVAVVAIFVAVEIIVVAAILLAVHIKFSVDILFVVIAASKSSVAVVVE